MKILSALLVALAFVGLVNADNFRDGHVNSDGYTYRAGLWYYPGYTTGYTRSLIASPGYYSCGRYYAGASYYQYVAVPVAAQATPTPPAYGPDWKTQAIKYAEARDDYAAYLATLKALGVQGQQYSFQQGGYGHGLAPVNATTPYSYSYNTLAQAYGDLNLNQLYQQSAQLTAGAQTLAGTAQSGHQQLVGQAGLNAAAFAEILAKGQSAAQVLKAFNGPNTFATQTNVQGVLPTPQVQPAPQALPAGNKLEALQSVIGNRCASCHSGNVKKGGVDLADYPSYTVDQKERVWKAITSMDAKTMMPLNGPRLTAQEMKAFFDN